MAGVAVSLAVADPSWLVRKWTGYLVMPLGLVWLGSLALAVWLFRSGQRRAGLAAVVLFGVCGIGGNMWVGGALLASLERDYSLPPVAPATPFEAVAVLGGANNQRPWGEPQLAPGGDRLATAARMFRRGWTERVVCFGSRIGEQDFSSEAALLVTELGVPSERVTARSGVLSTTDEIDALALIMREHGWTRVGLITSAFHLRRAIKLAASRGIDVTPLASDFQGGGASFTLDHLVPTAVGAQKVTVACWELLGAAVGR